MTTVSARMYVHDQHKRGIVVGNGQLKNIQILILFFPLTLRSALLLGQPALHLSR